MNIIVENEAVKWFKEELRINRNDCIRFVVRYGGNSSIQPGYSLGIVSEKPDGAIVSVEKDGTLFLWILMIFGTFKTMI